MVRYEASSGLSARRLAEFARPHFAKKNEPTTHANAATASTAFFNGESILIVFIDTGGYSKSRGSILICARFKAILLSRQTSRTRSRASLEIFGEEMRISCIDFSRQISGSEPFAS